MNRRSFIRQSALASAALLTPHFLWSAGRKMSGIMPTDKILVIVQLSGGNDGLNTVIPYQDDWYYKLRPGIALEKKEILTLHDQFGWNSELSPMRELYENGFMSIYNRVGYPNPDRSHFRSMDIWHSASDANEYRSDGWIGRYIDASCNGCAKPHLAIELDESLSLALKGEELNGLAVSNPVKLKKALSGPLMQELMQMPHEGSSNLSFLYKTLSDTGQSVDYLFEHSRQQRTSEEFPSTGFSNDLRMIASLINSGSETKVYYVSLTGFDTHNNQKNRQRKLLREYSEGISAFYRELKKSGNWNRTMIMTFSEFGRRAEQNASGGTDHGKANCLFLAGGSIKNPGFQPVEMDLQHTDDGDIPFETDFRRIYTSLLDNWLEADAKSILGKSFSPVLL